jgi:hypothetical protein
MNRRCSLINQRESFLLRYQCLPLESHVYNLSTPVGSHPVRSITCKKNMSCASIIGLSQGKKWWLGTEPFFIWIAMPRTKDRF